MAKNLQLWDERCRSVVNGTLQRERSAYRVVEAEIVEITSEHEIQAIEEGLKIPTRSIRDHLARALELLLDRVAPDYRNSIKESVAVEAACRRLAESDKATLGVAIKKIDGLHPAMEKGFSSKSGRSCPR